ncbi:MAG: hypothetical protein L0H31_04085 [Nocardioidaceae bacterium]|nr:hypothetical protein [Nocardioidaceae bacterium]
MAKKPDPTTLIPISLIFPGIGLTLLGSNLDGFVKGMCQGAGVMLILIGVFILGARFRSPREENSDAMWLPSRDEDEQ